MIVPFTLGSKPGGISARRKETYPEVDLWKQIEIHLEMMEII